jgi:hypothetical protein
MDPSVKDEAIRRLQEEIRKEEEATELAKQKVLEEQKAAEARIHEEFIRLRAEEERVRIEAEKLALQAQAKRIAEQKEAAIQEELDRLRNRTPFEVLRDDFKTIVKKLSKLETKPDHTEPISGLEAKLSSVLEENKRLQAQITALTTGFQAKLTALSTELNSVKEGKAKEEAAVLERLTFMESLMLRASNSSSLPEFQYMKPELLKRKSISQGYRKYNITKPAIDGTNFTLKFQGPSGIATIQLRFVQSDTMLYLSHQTTPRPHGHSHMSPEKPFGASPFLVPHGSTTNLQFQLWVYPGKILLKNWSGGETYSYIPEGIQMNNNEFFNWTDMSSNVADGTRVTCTEQN